MLGGSPPAKVRRCGGAPDSGCAGSGSTAASEDAEGLPRELFQSLVSSKAVGQTFTDTLSRTLQKLANEASGRAAQGQQLALLQAQEAEASKRLKLLQEDVASARAAQERRRQQAMTAAEEEAAVKNSAAVKDLQKLQAELQEKELEAQRRAEAAIDRAKGELSEEKQRLQAALDAAELKLTKARCSKGSSEKVLSEVLAQQQRALEDLQVASREQHEEDEREKAECEEELSKAQSEADRKRKAADERCNKMLQWIADTVDKARVSKRQQVNDMERHAEEAETIAADVTQRMHLCMQTAHEAAEASEQEFKAAVAAKRAVTENAKRSAALWIQQEQKQVDEQVQSLRTDCEQQQIVASMLAKEAESSARLAAAAKQRMEGAKARTKLAQEQADMKRKQLTQALQCMDGKLWEVIQEAQEKQAAALQKAEERIDEAYARAEAEENNAAVAVREAQCLEQIAAEAKTQSERAIRLAKQTRETQVKAAEELASKAVNAVADNMRLAGAGKQSLLTCLLGDQVSALVGEGGSVIDLTAGMSGVPEDDCQPSTPEPRHRAGGASSSVRHPVGAMEELAGGQLPQSDSSNGVRSELRGFHTLLEQRRLRAATAGQAHRGLRVSNRRQGRF